MEKLKLFLIYFISFLNADAQSWRPLGAGFQPNGVRCLISYGNRLYAGGGIATSGTTIVNGIAKWDGLNWSGLLNGSPFGGSLAMASYNNDLIAAGNFQNMSGVPGTESIARWDGIDWHSLRNGVPFGTVKCMAEYNGSLYIGGNFTKVDTFFVNDIARWDGSNWYTVCTLSLGLSQVESMAIYNNELYIGGYFGSINGVPMANIAKFDGTTWSQVGGGLSSDVKTLFADSVSNRLYAGGNFTYDATGSLSFPSNTGYWDGTSWTSIDNGIAMYPNAVTVYHNNLYIGFYSPKINTTGDTLRGIASWDGTDWQSVGKGLNAGALTFLEFDNELVVGGGFTMAGDSIANLVAAYSDTTTTNINSIKQTTPQTKLYPNPTKQTQVYYTCTLAANQTGNLQVTDMLGNILATYNLNSGSNKITINTAAYAKGVYVVKVNVVGRAGESLKLVVQ